ncbi:MAG: hypothetical protein JXR41_08885, partial [Bacteroidales bacterium]|nr:hypothetical protein [Bacteroidales bacterium]
MKDIRLKIILHLIIAGLLCYSCQPGSSEYRSPAWSSHDPLAIPYWIRQQKAEKENLIYNPSFETGKWLVVDSLRKSFSVDGWHKVGNNVQWIDLITDTTLSASEIFSGQRAVKITRTSTDEFVEKGDGIMSNFIRVIPGNYSFSFYTRLSDVRPYSVRLGTRMYDAIDIKLIFYDKSKIQIDSRYLMPYKDQKIDNAFKSLSFANYDHIKTFEWGRIIGKSHNFPFSEGDIPDDSRYVRLYIGLKGTGTMWIDDIDFHYTNANFTPLERFREIIDSSLTKHDLIIPTPREITKMESVVLYKKEQGVETLPKIIVPVHHDKSLQMAASLLKERIIHLLKIAGADSKITENITVQSSISDDELKQSKIIFSVGKTLLYKKYKDILPIKSIVDHDQGYFVYTSNDIPNVLFLAGNNETGDYYAAATVLQLFDNQCPVLYNARIIDYPDIRQRFFTVNAWQNQSELDNNLKTIQKLLPYKLNGAYIGVNLNMPLHFYMNSLEHLDNVWGHSNMFRFMQWVAPV